MSVSGRARDDFSQRLLYIRRKVTITDTGLSAGIKIGTLPARAFIHSIAWHLEVSFNSVTTDTLQLGTTATGTNILAATSVHGATGYQAFASAAGLGFGATSGTSDVDVYTQWAQTGGAGTAGSVTVVIAYITDHDQ